MDILSILVSISFLMFFAYRGYSILVITPLLATFAVLISQSGYLLATYTQIFMDKLGDFVVVYFPLFLLSAIFGKLMEFSGSAKNIAYFIANYFGKEKSILAVIISCSILTYGGVSLFVVVFAVYPIAVELFKQSNTPKRLIPGSIALGAFTYTMTALPGTPSIQNVIPSQYFGTDTFAAPFLGITAAIIMFCIGMFWLTRQAKKAKNNQEGYGNYQENTTQTNIQANNLWLSLCPIVLVLVINYISTNVILPNVDTSYLAEHKYGATNIQTVASNWGIIIALFFASLFIIATNLRKVNMVECLNVGAVESLSPIFNTASVVGYGAVISSLPGFLVVRDWILSTFPNLPMVSSAVVTSILSGITGSASGGMSIALENLGEKYLLMAKNTGVDAELIHRIVSISSGSLDTLPHNGAVITLLAICSLKHKDSYIDIFVVSLISPILTTGILIFIQSVFGIF